MPKNASKQKENLEKTPGEKVVQLRNIALNRNERVLRCESPEAYVLYDLTIQANKLTKNLRNGLMNRYSPEQALGGIERISKAIVALADEVEAVALEIGDKKYKSPSKIQSLKTQIKK